MNTFDPKTKARLDLRARMLKALAHPSRLFMLEQLGQGEQCVCKLAEKLGIDMSTASKHLTLMKHVGIVEDEKRGSMVFYRLVNPDMLECLSGVDEVLKAAAKAHFELVR